MASSNHLPGNQDITRVFPRSNTQTPGYPWLIQDGLIRGIKLSGQQLKSLRNQLYRKYYPEFYARMDPNASFQAWDEWIMSSENTYRSRGYKRGDLEAARALSPYRDSTSVKLEEMLQDEIQEFADPWPCYPFSERKDGAVVHFPRGRFDDQSHRSLIFEFTDTLGRPKYELMLGIVTAVFIVADYDEARNGQRALSGVKAEEIDCRPQLRSFLSRYFSTSELNIIMDSYGSYVSDYLN